MSEPKNLFEIMCQTNNNKPLSYYSNMISRYQALEQPSNPPAAYANTKRGRANKESTMHHSQGSNPTGIVPSKQPKKKVTFKPTATVRKYSTAHNGKHMTKEEKSKIYYSKHELKVFNLEAHAICALSQGLPDIRNPGTLLALTRDPMVAVSDNHTVDSLRGLELMMFPKRRQNKIRARKSLLEYQMFLNSSRSHLDSEQKRRALAAASAKLNQWPSFVAMETARMDTIRAYEGEYMIHVDVPKPVVITSPFPFHGKKRQISLDDAVGGTSPQTKRRRVE